MLMPMTDWLALLLEAKRRGEPLVLPESPLPGAGRVLALAPHPDDPDTPGVLLRALACGGWEVYWSILTSGWSGVQDDFVGPDRLAKGLAREAEQRASAEHFGLPMERLTFLRLPETEEGELAETEANRREIFAHLDALAPELVVLPYGNDSNVTHRLTYRWFAAWAEEQPRRVVAFAFQDPKSLDFHPDFLLTFDEETVVWKTTLLECHRSQSARNQATRGITFAERILAVNREGEGFAERYSVAVWR